MLSCVLRMEVYSICHILIIFRRIRPLAIHELGLLREAPEGLDGHLPAARRPGLSAGRMKPSQACAAVNKMLVWEMLRLGLCE